MEPNPDRAADYLYEAGCHDSLEARWIIELCRARLFSGSRFSKRTMGNNAVFQIVTDIVKQTRAIEQDVGHRYLGYKAFLNYWKHYDWRFTSSLGFSTENGSVEVEWTPESVQEFIQDVVRPSGKPLCDIVVSYQTLLTPNNTTTFLESCVTLGPEIWETVSHLIPTRAEVYSHTSYGNLGELYFRLLLAASKAGHFKIACSLIQVIDGLRHKAAHTFSPESATGESPMHHLANFKASRDQMDNFIDDLQRLGFDINAPITARSWISPHGIELYGTPLQIAVRYRSTRTVLALVNAGADADLGFHDSPAPLSLATSLNDSITVRYLLRICSPEKAKTAIKALGTPPKRGWFEHLMSDVATKEAGFSLVETAFEYFRAFFNSEGQLDGYTARFIVDLDGSPLIEAINRGQRNLGVLATLIGLGLAPRSVGKKWELFEAVLKFDVHDPFRVRLLQFFFSRREVERVGFAQPLLPQSTLHTTTWIAEWPKFFRTFRLNEGRNNRSTIFHVLAIREDYQALQILLTFFPHISVSVYLLSTLDSRGMSPTCIARRLGDKSLYQLLRDQVWTFGRQLTQSYRELRLKQVSQQTLDEEWVDRQVAKYPDWVTAPAYVRSHGVFSQALEEKYYVEQREDELRATARGYEERIASLLNQDIGWLTIAPAIERYACWALANERGALAKAEDLVVVANLMRMAVSTEISGIVTDKMMAASWHVPDQLRRFYETQTLAPKPAAKMLMAAYARMYKSPPKWMRGVDAQSSRKGIEFVLAWFKERRFREENIKQHP